jgi:hypothetical protein
MMPQWGGGITFIQYNKEVTDMASSKIGRWAFIIAALLAILAGFVSLGTAVPWILIVLGLIVGFMNITDKESEGFLIATVALMVALKALSDVFSGFAGGLTLKSILDNVVTIAAPAAVVVAVKHLYQAAQD